ncbi:hypothetical protein ACWAT4_26480 [Bradyrhizobium manausense]
MKIVDIYTFTHDVPIMMPSDGGYTEETLNTTFNYLSTDEIEKLGNGFLEKAVVTFNGLTDDDNKPVDCTDELRAQFLRHPNVMHGLIAHYTRAVMKVKPGN